MLLHLHDRQPRRIMIVTLSAFKMRMEFKIVDVVLAMAGSKANHEFAPTHQPQ
jgi:hypothetical protein